MTLRLEIVGRVQGPVQKPEDFHVLFNTDPRLSHIVIQEQWSRSSSFQPSVVCSPSAAPIDGRAFWISTAFDLVNCCIIYLQADDLDSAYFILHNSSNGLDLPRLGIGKLVAIFAY
jgi:hypothetical protein